MSLSLRSVRFVRLASALGACLLVLSPLAVCALTQAETDVELRYADGLNALGLPDYAEEVLSKLGAGPEVKVRRLQSLLARGQFEEVKRLIAAEPNQDAQATWAMQLSLADAHFAFGQYPEAQAVYQAFFNRFPDRVPEKIKEFYLESAYKYGQMLLLMGKRKEAIDAFEKAINANPPAHIKRQMMS